MRLPFAKPPKRRKRKPKPIARSAPPKRSGRVKRKPRPADQTERAHGSPEFRAWMKTGPCIVPGCRELPTDAAHIRSGGKGRKADWTETVKLCSSRPQHGYLGHHDQFDNAKKSFPKKHSLDMDAEAALNQERWRAHLAGELSTEHTYAW